MKINRFVILIVKHNKIILDEKTQIYLGMKIS